MGYRFLVLPFFVATIFSCNSRQKTTDLNNSMAEDTTMNLDQPIKSKDGEITKLGLVKEVEDSGYPFAVVNIEFPDRKSSAYFTVNLEDVANLTSETLRSYIGKYVNFSYTSEVENALLDLYQNKKSLLGIDSPPTNEEVKVIEGTLKDADAETQGDLPGEVTILSETGEKMHFEFFITSEMVAANGTKVKAYYEQRTANTIKSIRLSDGK